MFQIWRKWQSVPRDSKRSPFVRHSCLGLSLLHGLMGVVVLPGCAWVRAQAQHRSKECEQLCDEAQQAQQAGRVDRADQLLDRALRKSPRDLEVQRQLADSLWQTGRYKESLAQLAQLADDHPQDHRLAILLAQRHFELEQYQAALDRLEPVLKTEPVSCTALELKARIEIAQDRSDAALATWQQLSRQESHQAAALLQMAAIHLERGQPERAAPLLRTAVALPQADKTEHLAALWTLGIAYARTQRWQDAAEQLSAAAKSRVMTPDDWHAVAYASYRSGDWQQSQLALRHALTLEPQHAAAQQLTAALYENSGMADRPSRPFLPTSFERASPAP